MKHLKTIFACMLMAVLSIGQVWGYTITFAKGSGDGSNASTSTACSTIVSDGASYLSGNLATASKVYYSGGSGLKLGAASNAGTIKMNLASSVTPTSIVVSAKLYNSNKSATLKVNGSAAQNITSNFSNLTFNITSSISYIQLESSKYCWIESITVNTSSNNPTLSSLAISGDLVTKSYEEGQSIDFTGLTATGIYDDESTEDLTDDVEWSFSPALAIGTTSYTVTATLDDISGNKVINGVTVTEHVVTPGEYTINLTNTLFGTAENTNISSEINASQNDISLVVNGTGQTKPRTDATYIRFYGSSSLGLSVPSGYNITKIIISANESDYSAPNVSVGEFNTSTKTWTGKSNEVLWSFTAKSFIGQIKVTYEAIAPDVTVDPSSLSFDAKQNIAVDGKTFTLEGANLTNGLTLAASAGFSVNPTSITAADAMAQGGVEVTVTPATPTATTTPVEGTVTISGGGLTSNVVVNLSMSVIPTYLVAIAVNDNTMGSATINGGTTAIYVTEDDVINLVATPKKSHEFVNWTVSDDNIVLDNANVASTTALTAAAGTITANFQAQSCASLAAPTLNGNVVVSYNSATINWNIVTNASSYDVTIVKHSDSESIFSGNVNALTKVLANLEPETQYDYSIMAIGDGTSYCDANNSVLEGNFTTTDYPTVAVTYSENGKTSNANTTAATAKKILTPYALPTTVETEISGKDFVGWTTKSDFADGDESSDSYYAKGAEFTISNNAAVTLYAVYATSSSDDSNPVTITLTNKTIKDNASNKGSYGTYTLDTYWTGKWMINNNSGTYSLQLGYNTSSSKSAYNSHLTLSALPGGATSVHIETNNNTASGRTFYLCNADDKGTASSGDYGSGSISQDNGSVDITVTDAPTTFHIYPNGTTYIKTISVTYLEAGETTYSDYVISGTAAPTATPDPSALTEVVAAGTSGTITMTYENVNTGGVTIGLFNNEACTEAFSGEWLTASLNNSKNITYTIAENTSYNDARSAYIKLTAPETTGATDPAVVVIPVSQVKKAAVFSSLADLAAADVASGTNVTVTINNRITDIYTNHYNYRYGIYLNVQKYNQEETPVLKDIEIYFKGEEVPASDPEWVIGGTVSGTITCPLNYYYDGNIWQLTPAEGWHWTNLTYTAPATVSSVVVNGTPSKTTYNVGEAFDPAGLNVHVVYSDNSYADITASDDDWAYVTWNINPATFAAEHIGTGKSVSVTATYSAVASSATEISGLTVNKVAVSSISLNQNAVTLKAGKTVKLTATIAPINATYKGIEWSTSDGSIATVEDGVVTAGAEGSATITATATDDNTKTATCTITVTAGINFAAGDWTLVTDAAELTAGSYVIIAASGYDKAMKSYESGNNCKPEDATKSGDLLEYDEDFGIFEIGDYEISSVIYKTFQDVKTEQYLFISSNNNHLKAQNTKNENAAWTITSVSNVGVAIVTSKSQSNRTMRYNGSDELFACYTTGQSAIALYKYYAPVPKVTYNKNTTDEVTNLPDVQKTVWENDAYKATVAAGPIRSTYIFTGWNSAENGNGDAYAAGTKYSFTADITLYAQWAEAPKYTLTYDMNGGSGNVDAATEYYPNDEVTLSGVLEKEGLLFAGWEYDGNVYAAGATFTMPETNVTMKAKFVSGAMYSNMAKVDNVWTIQSVGAPQGTTATYTQTYATTYQITQDNSMTLTLSGYYPYTIKGVTLSMKSNKSSGAGTLSVKIGNTTVATEANADVWYGPLYHSQEYEDIHIAMTPTRVMAGENIVIKIEASEKSLYCQSFMIEYEVVRDEILEVVPGTIGTYCPKKTVKFPAGATFYAMAYVKMVNDVPYKVYFDELAEDESLIAGHPYFYIADDDVIMGIKVGDAATAGINDKGLIGKVDEYLFQVSESEGNQNSIFVVYQNSIKRCGDGWFRLGAEKAYIDLRANGLITNEENAPQPAPGRRRASISNAEAPQVATGLDALSDDSKTMKVIIDNQLFIIRNGKIYDTTGRLVENY